MKIVNLTNFAKVHPNQQEIIMEDSLPDIFVKTECESKSFIKNLLTIAKSNSNSFEVKVVKDCFIDDSEWLGIKPIDQNGHQNITSTIFSIPGKDKIVQVEVNALKWKAEPVTYEMYVSEARRILTPLLSDYNKINSVRRRLSIQPKVSLKVTLPPKANKIFKTFVSSANRNILHPLDWRRFYIFIRHCRSRKVNIYPDDLKRLLIEYGFEETKASYLADIFSHGRNLLGTH